MRDIFKIQNHIIIDHKIQNLDNVTLKNELVKMKDFFSHRNKSSMFIGIEGGVEILFNGKLLVEISEFETLDVDLFWRDTVLEAIEMFLEKNKGMSYFLESDQKLMLEAVGNKQLISCSIEGNKIEKMTDHEITINPVDRIIKKAVLDKGQFFKTVLDEAENLFNFLANLNLPQDNYLFELARIKN